MNTLLQHLLVCWMYQVTSECSVLEFNILYAGKSDMDLIMLAKLLYWLRASPTSLGCSESAVVHICLYLYISNSGKLTTWSWMTVAHRCTLGALRSHIGYNSMYLLVIYFTFNVMFYTLGYIHTENGHIKHGLFLSLFSHGENPHKKRENVQTLHKRLEVYPGIELGTSCWEAWKCYIVNFDLIKILVSLLTFTNQAAPHKQYGSTSLQHSTNKTVVC